MGRAAWELVFLMLILKIPIVYLCAVIWWAIKAEPRPEEGSAVTAGAGPEAGGGGDSGRRRRRLPRPPHGRPSRRPPRAPRPSLARAEGTRR